MFGSKEIKYVLRSNQRTYESLEILDVLEVNRRNCYE